MRAEELLDAWDQGLDPLKDQPVLGAPKTAEDIVDDWDAESGGLLSGIKDMGVYALSAIPSAAQGIVDVGRMATGDPDILKNFSDWIGEQTDSFKDFALSDAALAQQRRLDRVMADPNYSIADLPAVMADNPRATLGSAVESAGSMLLPTGTGVAAARLVGQMGRLAQAGRGGALARVLGNVAPSKAAAAGTMVGNAALNAADTYSSDALENQDQADRYLGALVSAGTSMLGSKVTGGGAENILAQLFTGNAARQIGKNAATRALVGMVKGGGKEFVQEGIEETGNIAGEVVGSGQPIDWNQGAKRVGLASTLGAIMGGPIGATSSIAARPQTIQQDQTAIPQDTDVQAAVEGALEAIGDLASTRTPQAAPQVSRQEVKPQETPLPQVQPRGQNAQQVQPQARQTQPTPVDNAEVVAQQNTVQPTAQSTSQAPVILQNRDRSNKASIEQMDRIAGNPDYGRVGIGRDFANGAPVVAYGSVPENQKGRVDYATAATGERIPIQYAVVEADTVSTSHDITGNKNPNYGRTDLVTAIAGNGRVTGIAAAYRKGTAAKYRQELAEDSAMHGVNPEVINGMRNPVLVRIMPNERVTGNIGDLSNTTGNNQLNAVEKAHTDANRVNFEGMEFNEDGSPTQDSIVGFIRSMPAGERAELIDEHGRPNSQAIDRLNNAIFAKAYGNDDVIAMYAMAVDPEAKLVINTLSAVAPKMARLEGCGELDFRGVLIQAVNQIVEGKRKGLKMQDIVKQVDVFTDPDISLFLDLFAQNPRSNKQVIEVLSDAADFAYNEATRDTETEDMFGGVQKASRADLMQHIQQTNNQITELRNAQRQAKRSQTANIQNSAGSVRSGQNAPGGNAGANPSQNEPRGSSDAQGNEGFSLTGQTESEIEAEAQAREEAEAQRAREESQDQQRQEAQNLRNEVKSLNDDYSENFTLTDDSTSAEDALRGQSDLKFSRNPETNKPDIKFSLAWHGSPYNFETFASEHIGTGTGRLTHGWGLYFTGDRKVAEKYRDSINKDGSLFKVEIPDDDVLLDTDATFEEQPQKVKEAITKLYDEEYGDVPIDWWTGRQIYQDIILREEGYSDFDEIPGDYEIEMDLDNLAGDSRLASEKLNSIGVKGIKFIGDDEDTGYVVFDDKAIEVLNYYSRIQGDQQGSTVDSITETLSNDSDIGEAFRNLRSRGSVVVIQSESELPGFSMASRSPMKSVDANIRRGKEAMAKALSEKTTVHRAMFRTGMGWVDFVWGDVGGDVKSNGQRPGEKGIAHIIEARQRKDGLTEKQTVALLDRIVETIARGSEVKRREFNGHQRVDLGYNGVLATLVKNPGSNAWLLTGFEIRESDDNRVGKDSPTSTSDAPHTPGAGEVADSLPPRTGNERHALATETVGLGERPSMDVTSSVGSEDLIVKRSTDGSIQGAYDPRTQKVYLVADNLTDENARAVFMHEVGVHMAADGDMKAVFARAKQIVWNGAANGDKVAQAAKRRMDAAGETSPEEAAAYLVEEAVKAQKDLPKSHPIVQWLEDLMRRVRLWINKKLGVNNLPGLRLTTDDIVAVARANAKSLGNVERKPSNGMTTFADDYKGEWRERRGDLHTKKGGANIWSRNLGLRSGWGKLLERDERGDWKSGWGEHLVTGAGNFVLEAAEYFIPALRTKYAMRMAPKEVREMYRELRAQVENARRKAGKVAQEMAKWSDNDRRLISDVIEKALDADARPPEHVLKMASMMSDLMTKQGEDLVALGMLSEESFDRWRGQYLPRFYNRRKELEGEGWFKNFMKRGAPLRGVGGGSLKGRGKYELIEVKDLDKYIRDGWEVRDERYTFNKEAKESQPELTFKDMPEVEVDEHQTVNVWRDWTPKERQEMGEIRDAGYRFVMGYMQMQEDLALGRLFKQIAENPAWTRNTPSEGYSAVPDTVIPETGGVKRYGSLAGKYVKDEVLAQVMPHAEVPSAFARAYRNLLAYWKEGKTALNPVSHMNNTAGNIIMAHLAGVDMWNAKAYWDIAQAFRHNADWLKEAEDNGLFSGSFSKEEIAKLLPEEFTRLEEQQESMAKRGFEFVFNYLLNYGLRQKMRNLYEAEDSFFKALIYKYAKDRGMSTKDAIDYALGFIPTYDDLPGGARFIRDTAVPFFAWTYKIVPRLVTSAAAYPHRFLAPAALMWTANMLTYAIAAGDDDDDWWTRFEKGRKLQDTEEGLLPDYMQGRGFFMNPKFIRLWNDPTTNLPVYWNISNFIPGGQLFDSENQAGGMPWPEMLAIGSPLYTIWAALNLNTDTFTGRDVTKQSDTAGEATEKRATYLWRQLAPALAYGGYHFERVLNGLANATGVPIMGYTGIGRNKEPITPLNAAINTLGLKVRNVDFQKEYQFKMSDIQKVNDEILANIRSLNRQKKIGSIIPLEADKEIEYQREKLKDNTAHSEEITRLNRDRKKLSKGE